MRLFLKGVTLRNTAIGLTLTALSLLVVFAGGEIVCRLFFPDTHLRYKTDPEALYYFEPNQTGDLLLSNGLFSPPMHINRFGFRGGELNGSDDVILLLGDSFTFGSGVRDEETFAARLNQWVGKDLSVVNGGQPGYGVFQMAATLKRVEEILRPKLVVVVLWEGDLLRQPPSASERERFLKTRDQLKIAKTSVFLTQVYRRLERALLRLGLDRFVYHVGGNGAGETQNPARVVDRYLQGWEVDAPRLLAMDHEAHRYGYGILLVLWPKEDYASQSEPGLALQLTDTLGQFAKQHNIPFISLQAAMRQSRPAALLIPGDYHPTPLAHCLAAKEIGRELTRLGVAITVQAASCSSDPTKLSRQESD